MSGNNTQLISTKKVENIANKYVKEISMNMSQEQLASIITNIITDAINAIDHEAIANIAIAGLAKQMKRY